MLPHKHGELCRCKMFLLRFLNKHDSHFEGSLSFFSLLLDVAFHLSYTNSFSDIQPQYIFLSIAVFCKKEAAFSHLSGGGTFGRIFQLGHLDLLHTALSGPKGRHTLKMRYQVITIRFPFST